METHVSAIIWIVMKTMRGVVNSLAEKSLHQHSLFESIIYLNIALSNQLVQGIIQGQW